MQRLARVACQDEVMPRPRQHANLSRSTIGAAATELIEEVGHAAFSIRRLGAALGCDPMTLYQYVSGKDDVLSIVVDSVFAEVEVPSDELATGEWLLQLSTCVRSAFIAHPQVMPLIGHRLLPGGPAEQELLDHVVGRLAAQPHALSLADRVNAVIGGLIGYVMLELSVPSQETEQQGASSLVNIAEHASELDGRIFGSRALNSVVLLPGGFEVLMHAIIARVVES
jgi:AcrR family transcriptional regulator